MIVVKEVTEYPMYLQLQESVFGADEWPPVERNMMNRKNYIHLGGFVGKFLVAGISAKIVNKTTSELVLVCTLPEMRGKGIARLLIDHLTDRLRDRGVTSLYVENYLESARTWYLKNKFKDNDLVLEMNI